jgi:multidrug resistance efflux pump
MEAQEQPKREFDLRSEDISEILGTPPSWLVRWGTTVIFLVFGILLVASWTIQYPDVIPARVEFTTAIPPVEVVARTEGHIEQFLVAENDAVIPGQALVVLQNTAKFDDVLKMEQLLGKWESADTPDSLLAISLLEGNPELGELRNDYAGFLQQLDNYQFSRNKRTGATTANVSGVEQQIGFLRNGIKMDQSNERKAATELESAKQEVSRQREAFKNGVISQRELDPYIQRVADAERLYNTYADQNLRRQAEISGLQRSIGVVRFDDSLDANSSAGRLKSALSALRTALDQWKLNYLLTAPIAGRISLNKFYTARQYVKVGEQVLIVVPPTDSKIIGRSHLPIAGSGKVQLHQRVVIRLDNYPYYEFGTLRGVVLSKSSVPKDNAYIVTIGLDTISGTTTSYNKTIAFEQQLQGDIDIVTAEKRFLERIVDQLFASAR